MKSTGKKRIAVVTTGGDAPGMNSAIRSVVRSAIYHGYDIIGFKRGWWGMIEKDIIELDGRSVSNIINKGGTILHTVRCPLFKRKKHRETAAENLESLAPGGLVVIGGDGSMRAAYQLSLLTDVPIVGIPASIDNDIPGTDETIGFDTAINTALDATDKIRDTATSHQRVFIVEVMGRKRGFLAIQVGLSAGAEIVLVPEVKWKKENILDQLKKLKERGKNSIIIVMAEGAGDSSGLTEFLETGLSVPVRLSKLGYIQRGGKPTVDSRFLGTIFGYEAVNRIRKRRTPVMLAWNKDSVADVPIDYPFKNSKALPVELLDILRIVSA